MNSIHVIAIALGAFTAQAETELIVAVPNAGFLGLSTRGRSAFRVRFMATRSVGPIDTPMVEPGEPDAAFMPLDSGAGITSTQLGSVLLSNATKLMLYDKDHKLILESAPLGAKPGPPDMCTASPATDCTGGTRAGPPSTVKDQASCCAACKATALAAREPHSSAD